MDSLHVDLLRNQVVSLRLDLVGNQLANHPDGRLLSHQANQPNSQQAVHRVDPHHDPQADRRHARQFIRRAFRVLGPLLCHQHTRVKIQRYILHQSQ